MSHPPDQERFSRQTILPGVGPEGQEKWSKANVFLVGEGPAIQSAALALVSSGVSRLTFPVESRFDRLALTSSFPQLKVDVLPQDLDQLPPVSMTLVLSEDPALRRKISRSLRHQAHPAVFGWPAASGFALLAVSHQGGQCPCLECFEIMNPKAFTKGTPAVQEMTGSMAATEALLWILKGSTPLEGRVWVNALASGISIHHPVQPTYKCTARMLEEGATVTP